MITKQEREVLKQAAAIIVRETDNGEKVILRDFGTFSRKERAARKGRNPQTGEEITIAARSVLAFKASAGQTIVK